MYLRSTFELFKNLYLLLKTLRSNDHAFSHGSTDLRFNEY